MTNLFPIRIDASTNDGGVRLVDTLLIDPTCFPFPLTTSSAKHEENICSADTINSSIDAMSHEFADNLLADMEVRGMTRTSKHYTGRINLLGRMDLKKRVEDQIRDQIRVLVWGDDDASWERDHEHSRKKPRLETDGKVAVEAPELDGSKTNKEDNQKSLVRINIRIRYGDIMVVDDFDWDPCTPAREGGCPISVANGIVKDLNLPPALAVAISTSIVEQLHKVQIDEDPKIHVTIPAAWKIDPKEREVADAAVLARDRSSVSGMMRPNTKWSTVKSK